METITLPRVTTYSALSRLSCICWGQMLRLIEGPAGTGKSTRLFEELERILVASPLQEYQRVLALTRMHGSRRRMEDRLQNASTLRMRYRCSTVDSFAWSLI